MRHRTVWAAGLALGLGMGMVGLAAGQEPARTGPGLLDRLFTSPAPPARGEPKADAKKEVNAKPASVTVPSISRDRALKDYLRRLEVCDRIRQIADTLGDEELKNRAEVLEIRAKDIYVQQTNPGATADVDEQMLERQLAPNGRNPTPLSATSKNRNSPSYAEGPR